MVTIGYNPHGWYGFNTDRRKPLHLGLGGWFFVQEAEETHSAGFWGNISWRPATTVDLSISPDVDLTSDDWQFLEQGNPFGVEEYVFGELHQTTVSMTFRGNVTFTPTLTLQAYAEPFVSSGRYLEFKRVAAPRAERYVDRFDVFGSDRLVRQGDEVSVDLNRDGTGDIDLGGASGG